MDYRKIFVLCVLSAVVFSAVSGVFASEDAITVKGNLVEGVQDLELTNDLDDAGIYHQVVTCDIDLSNASSTDVTRIKQCIDNGDPVLNLTYDNGDISYFSEGTEIDISMSGDVLHIRTDSFEVFSLDGDGDIQRQITDGNLTLSGEGGIITIEF